jgi:hypothetical protein
MRESLSKDVVLGYSNALDDCDELLLLLSLFQFCQADASAAAAPGMA